MADDGPLCSDCLVGWVVGILLQLDIMRCRVASVLLQAGIITRTYKFQRRRGAAPAGFHCTIIEAAEFQQSSVAAGCPAVLSDNLTLTTEILIVTRPDISLPITVMHNI